MSGDLTHGKTKYKTDDPGSMVNRYGKNGKFLFHPRNYSWAELMRRVFAVDVLECPKCHGRIRILVAIHPPDAIRKILDCLGLPSRPPPISRARLDPDIDQLYLS